MNSTLHLPVHLPMYILIEGLTTIFKRSQLSCPSLFWTEWERINCIHPAGRNTISIMLLAVHESNKGVLQKCIQT